MKYLPNVLNVKDNGYFYKNFNNYIFVNNSFSEKINLKNAYNPFRFCRLRKQFI